MGPSGSGKSTLLTIAGSLEEPSSGEVIVGGRAAVAAVPQRARRPAPPRDRLRLPGLQSARRADRGGERCRCRWSWTASACVPHGRQRWRRSNGWAFAERADRFPDELSGGERQRVAIARAVVGDRHLLLADEPSGALDSVNGEAVMRLVRETCQAGVAGVVVTHDAQLASWADRVIFLRDGRIVDQTAAGRRDRSRCSTRMPRGEHHPRPAAAGRRAAARRSGAPARRAIRRWAWRLLRREWRQQVLVLALLTVAVSGDDGRARARRQRPAHRSGRVRHRERAGRDRRSRARAASPPIWPLPGSVSAPSRRSPTRRAGARLGHAGRPASAGPAWRLQQADAARGVGPLSCREPARRPVTRAVGDDVRPEARLVVDGQRALAARRRHRREPQEFAGLFRPRGSR